MAEGVPHLETLPKNVELVETATGKYRLIYSMHFIPNQLEELGDDCAGVVLEGMIPPTDEQTIRGRIDTMQGVSNLLSKTVNEQYAQIFSALAKQQKPMFIVDIHGHVAHAIALIYGVPIAEWVLANFALRNEPVHEHAAITRRDFLIRGAKTLARFYLKGDALGKALASTSTYFIGARLPANVAEKMYPQANLYVLTLRNLVAAEKMEQIYQEHKDQFDGKELIAIYGAFHTGISEALKMGREARLKKIGSIVKLLSALNMPISTDELALILTLSFDEQHNGWHVANVKENHEIASLASRSR